MVSEEKIREALKQVVDPELNFNIVDLGLIYEVKVNPDETVYIKMTLTSPGCPVGPQILANVKRVAKELEGVKDVKVELTFEPMWSPEKATEELQEVFGQYM